MNTAQCNGQAHYCAVYANTELQVYSQYTHISISINFSQKSCTVPIHTRYIAPCVKVYCETRVIWE